MRSQKRSTSSLVATWAFVGPKRPEKSDPGDRRAETGDPLEYGGSSQRLVCQIEADHRQRPARRENDRGGLRVDVNIKFSGGCRIASGVGAAHENYFFDFLDDPRVFTNGHGDVRQGPRGHQCDVATGLHQELDDHIDGVPRVERHGRLAERRAVEPRLAVNIPSRLELAGQRPVAAGRDGDVLDPGDGSDAAGVKAGLVEGLVPRYGRDGDELDLRVAMSEQDRHGVIVAGIAIQDYLSRHLLVRE